MDSLDDIEMIPPENLPSNSIHSYNPLHSNDLDASGSDQSPHMRSLLEQAINEALAMDQDGEEIPGQKFDLRQVIGMGGFGEVWEALQVELNRVVAVKRLRRDLSESGAVSSDQISKKLKILRLNSRQEAFTTANLEHPNIVPVHDLGTAQDGSPLIAMKYIRGKPWDEQLREDFERLNVEEFLQTHIPILIQMTQAVAFAHSKGVVHRDLKPSQVITGEFGEVLLADWGLALVMDHQQLGDGSGRPGDYLPTPAEASNPAGTPAFMAPEQTERTGANIGPWTDIYLLGGTLYYILTLNPPHGGTTAREAFMRANLGEVVPPNVRTPGRPMPGELVELALHAMKPERKDRIGSATEFLEALQRFQRGDSDRREAIRLIEAVSIRMEKDADSYEKFTQCLVDLGQAKALWSKNSQVDLLFDKVHSRICKLSLAQGDLSLARLQAGAIKDERARYDYEQRVELAEKKIRRRERHRFWAISMVWILVFFIIASFAVYQKNLIADRQALEDQRYEAMTSQRQTLDLIDAMMVDLQQRLEPAQQLGTLRTAAHDVLKFLGGLDPQSPEMVELVLESKAEIHMRIAMIERSLGNTTAALSSLEQYTARASEWRELSPRNAYAAALYSHARLFSAFVTEEMGRTSEAEKLFLKSISSMASFEVENHVPIEDEDQAGALEFLELYELELAMSDELNDFLDREIILLQSMTSIHILGRPRNFSSTQQKNLWFGSVGVGKLWLGEVYFRRGNLSNARRAYERAIPILERGTRSPDGELLPMEEWNWDSHLQLAYQGRIRLGECFKLMGDPVMAESTWTGLLELIQEGLIATEHLTEGPKGPGWISLAARSHRKLALLHLETGLFENALTEAQRSLQGSLRASIALPGNPDSTRSEMLSREVVSIVNKNAWKETGNESYALEAITQVEKALELGALLVNKDPDNYTWWREAHSVYNNSIGTLEAMEGHLPEDSIESLRLTIHQSPLGEER